MEIVSSVASTVTELLFDPIVRQIGYIWNYNSNVQKLRDEVEMLKAEQQLLQHKVEAAQRNGENIEALVEIWMRRASQITTDAEGILKQSETASKTCFISLKQHYHHLILPSLVISVSVFISVSVSVSLAFIEEVGGSEGLSRQ